MQLSLKKHTKERGDICIGLSLLSDMKNVMLRRLQSGRSGTFWKTAGISCIVLPRTENGLDLVNTSVCRISRWIHYMISKGTEISLDATNKLPDSIFYHHGQLNSSVLDVESVYFFKFGKV